MEIPKEVIEIIESESKHPFFSENDSKERIANSREAALNSIRIYKENKKDYEEILQRRTILSEWLKAVKEEKHGK